MTTDNEALPPLEREIDEYIDGYTLEGDDGYYQPNETERLIAKDVVMGLLAEPWFVAALAQRQQVPEHCPACGYELTAALAQRQQVPEGWTIQMEGDTAKIVSPLDGPGFKTVAEHSLAQSDRLLFALAKALTPAPQAAQVQPSTKAERVRAIVNAGPFPGMSEAFDRHMGAACWTEPEYQPDAATWAAAWRAATKAAQAQPQEPPRFAPLTETMGDGEIKVMLSGLSLLGFDDLSDFKVAVVRAYEKARGISTPEEQR